MLKRWWNILQQTSMMGSNTSRGTSATSTKDPSSEESHNSGSSSSKPQSPALAAFLEAYSSSPLDTMEAAHLSHPHYTPPDSSIDDKKRRRKRNKHDDMGDNDKSRFSMRLWCIAHRTEMAGLLLVLLGIIIVAATLLLPGTIRSKNQNSFTDGNMNNVIYDDDFATPPVGDMLPGQDPTLSGPRPPTRPQAPTFPPQASPVLPTPTAPVSAPITRPALTEPPALNVPPPISGTPPVASPVAPSTPAPVPLSLFQRLSLYVSDPRLLRDDESPQGRAYQWLLRVDERHVQDGDTSVTQRFVLAALYFSTGGGRTMATWKTCSAVPDTTTDSLNAFSSRCVFENGVHVCAAMSDYEDCTDENGASQKRWLSIASECEWYGVTCDTTGRIESLDLVDNGLDGEWIAQEMGILTSLKRLNLRKNKLRGTLPAMSDFMQLQELNLSDNLLQGDLTSVAISLASLRSLDISKNDFTGTLILPGETDTALQIPLSLRTLILADNPSLQVQLTSQIGLWTLLEVLDISGTTLIDGQIPGTIGNWGSLQRLKMGNCGLTGTIPPTVASLTALVELGLQSNDLTGALPIGLWDLSNLVRLRLDRNRFSGTISTNIGQLTRLEELNLERSGLSGNFPEELEDLRSLELGFFQFNGFSGRIPEGVCLLPNLEKLEADCDRQGGVECSCCTKCCSPRQNRCRD